MIWIVLLTLAFILGFVANRTTLCAVKAVDEILFQRHAKVLASFGKIILWACGTSIILEWVFGIVPTQTVKYSLNLQSLLGGLILGAGAVLNGGCALYTLIRLGRGDLGMLISITGISVSIFLLSSIQSIIPTISITSTISSFTLHAPYKLTLSIMVMVWMVIELFRLSRHFKLSQWRTRLLAECYQLSTASAILGICNGVLFAVVGTWSYTYTLITSVATLSPEFSHTNDVSSLLWGLTLTLLAGIAGSSFIKGRFTILFKPEINWLRYFSGGMLMGLGALLIPGGNDVLLLSAIPSGSPHALPVYLCMLLGISISLLIKTLFSK
jgi:uncharacterized membrane protein YedE/YeeE